MYLQLTIDSDPYCICVILCDNFKAITRLSLPLQGIFVILNGITLYNVTFLCRIITLANIINNKLHFAVDIFYIGFQNYTCVL